MKRAILFLALFALAAPGITLAGDDEKTSGDITLGVQQLDLDTQSSKFLEYRDVPDGAALPSFNLHGQKGDVHWSFAGNNTRLLDQRSEERRVGKECRL